MNATCDKCGGRGWLCVSHEHSHLNDEHDCAYSDCTDERRRACSCNPGRELPAIWLEQCACKGEGWVCVNHDDVPMSECPCHEGVRCSCNPEGDMPPMLEVFATTDPTRDRKMN